MKRRLLALVAAVAVVVASAAAWGYWSTGSVAGGGGAATAASVNRGATPTVSASGQAVTVGWAASTLTDGQPVAGYLVRRYTASTQILQPILSACTGTLAATSCIETNVPAGSWRYTVTPVIGASWRGAESAMSATVTVAAPDQTAPVNAVTVTSAGGTAAASGNTVFYRGVAAGSFTLTNAVTDAGSGPASSTTSALAGTSTGWTHTPSTVATPTGGPYVSNPFSWAAGTTSAPSETLTGRDVAGNTATTTLSFANDSSAPTAGTIAYAGGYHASRSVAVTFTTGTDSGSGIASRWLQRAAAPLTNGTCGTFGGFSNLGAVNPASPYTDGQLPNACYQYRYVVTDRVGNQHIATSADVVRVIDYASAVAATPGLISHWRLGEGAATLTSSDSFTGASGSLLTSRTGEIGATWTRLAGGAQAVITNANRVTRGTSSAPRYTINYASATPTSADYSVEADLVVQSNLDEDMVGVIGRLNTASNTFYMARWEQAATGTTGSWRLVRSTNGTVTSLGALTAQPQPRVGVRYRIKLAMSGTSLKLFVDGVEKVSATDATLTAAGRAGIMDGNYVGNVANKSNTTGIQLDNFQVTPSTFPRAADSMGTNPGEHQNGVTLGVPGALVADPDTSATFDGLNDVVAVPDAPSLKPTNITLEAWVKPKAGIPDYASVATKTMVDTWSDGYGMYAWKGGIDFWVNDDADDVLTAAVPTTSWSHVVGTYDGATIKMYLNGALVDTFAYAVPLVHSTAPLLIGDAGGLNNYHWAGGLDDVALYNRALTATEVAQHYQVGTTP